MRHVALCLLISCTILLLAVPGAARLEREEMTTRAVVNRALEERVIDEAQATLLKAYAVYAPWKLPEEFRGGSIDKCGTPAAEEISRALPGLPEDVAEEIRRLRERPICDTYVDSEHFRIHYDTSGQHMIYGWPHTAYRDAILVEAEHVWDQEVDVFGFRSPPSDGDDPDGGDDGPLYDIYLQELVGLYGRCWGSYYVPGTPLNDATSYIVIHNDFAGFGYSDRTLPMKVTIAHEFCHACQYAHDIDEDTWYKECTSMWAEEEIYDEVNDYRQYLSSWFNSP